MENEFSETCIATQAAKDRAMAYWTDRTRFPSDTETTFWRIINANFHA